MAKKILIVDDEPDVLKVESFRVKKLGFDVVTAVDGEEALAMIKRENPALVLLDLHLPKIGGSEVCARIKADKDLNPIPVILVTASAENLIDTAKLCGADDYLIKPFDPADLARKIEHYLS
jgi:CheY-like chemotaxis protein